MDLSNWRTAPYNIEAFRSIEKILPTQVVKKGSKETPLEAQPTKFDDFKIELGKTTLDLPSFEAASETDGIVILHKGKIVHENYHRGNDASSKHIFMSMTKSVTGLIAGILSSQGKFDVNAPIKKYVPFASSVWDNVTVQQCLDMNSGIKYPDDSDEYRASAGWNPPTNGEKPEGLRSFLSRVKSETDGPGAGFHYASVNTDLVGLAIEEATGKKLAESISELLWQPMGAESDAMLATDQQGTARAAGGMCATVRDLARIGQLVADGGRGIVPAAWIDDMLHGGDKESFARSTWAPGFDEGITYRSCWVEAEAANTFVALGIHGQQLVIDRANGIVMAKTSSAPDPVDFGIINTHLIAFKEFSRILLSQK